MHRHLLEEPAQLIFRSSAVYAINSAGRSRPASLATSLTLWDKHLHAYTTATRWQADVPVTMAQGHCAFQVYRHCRRMYCNASHHRWSLSDMALLTWPAMTVCSRHTPLGHVGRTGVSISCKGAQQQHSTGQQAPSSAQECGLQALQGGLDLVGAQEPVPGQHLWGLHEGLAIIPASAYA